jgi:hypothetical protein
MRQMMHTLVQIVDGISKSILAVINICNLRMYHRNAKDKKTKVQSI